MKFHKDTALFHHQIRVGKRRTIIGADGTPKRRSTAMAITKFRTMPRGAHEQYAELTRNLDHQQIRGMADSRLTNSGRAIRATKLDELPQIVNVLKGELTMVGIRPLNRVTYQKLPLEIKEIYDAVGPGLLGVDYSIPRSQRTLEAAFDAYKKFYEDWKVNPQKAYRKWAGKILKNIGKW